MGILFTFLGELKKSLQLPVLQYSQLKGSSVYAVPPRMHPWTESAYVLAEKVLAVAENFALQHLPTILLILLLAPSSLAATS